MRWLFLALGVWVQSAFAAPLPARDGDEGFVSPKIAALLPPSQNFGSLNLRVVNAGFANANDVPPQVSSPISADAKQTGFFFAFRVRAPQGWYVDKLAQLQKVTGPNAEEVNAFSTPITYNQPVPAQHVFASNVNPKWKWLTATFEVLDPKAPPHADGIYWARYSLRDVPLPPDGMDFQKPAHPVDFVAQSGAHYFLDAIARVGSELVLRWKAVPPADATTIDFCFSEFRVETRASISPATDSQWEKGPVVQFRCDGNTFSADERTAQVRFWLEERLPARRQLQFYSTRTFRIPVAPLFAASPPPRHPAPYAPTKTGNSDLELVWEPLSRQGKEVNGVLWMRDLKRSPFKIPPLQLRVARFLPSRFAHWSTGMSGEENRVFFHSDNRLAFPDERGASLQISLPDDAPFTTCPLQIIVQRGYVLRRTANFKALTLPAPGYTLEFGANAPVDQGIALRRIVNFAGEKLQRDKSSIVVQLPSQTFEFQRLTTLNSQAVVDWQRIWIEVRDRNGERRVTKQHFKFEGWPSSADPASNKSIDFVTPNEADEGNPYQVRVSLVESLWNGLPQSFTFAATTLPPEGHS